MPENFLSPEMMSTLTGYAVKVIGVLLLIIVAWIISGLVGGKLTRVMTGRNMDVALAKFAGSVSKWVVLLVAGVAALGVFGVETTSFAAVLGAAGLAIGLAFQGSLGNVAAGVMLLIFRPFTVGDVVSTGGVVGKVDAIGLFAVTLDTPDNRRIIVPNSTVFGATIENITFHDVRRVDIAVGTDYTADLGTVRKVLEEAAASVQSKVADPEPQIFLKELGGSSIDWQVRVWGKTGDYWDVWQETTDKVKAALDAAEVGIPFPQMDVHVDGKLG